MSSPRRRSGGSGWLGGLLGPTVSRSGRGASLFRWVASSVPGGDLPRSRPAMEPESSGRPRTLDTLKPQMIPRSRSPRPSLPRSDKDPAGGPIRLIWRPEGVFPDGYGTPSGLSNPPDLSLVPSLVRQQLVGPKGRIVGRGDIVLPASVPEATVNQHHGVEVREYDVCGHTTHSSIRSITDSTRP